MHAIKTSGAAFKPTGNLTQRCIVALLDYCNHYSPREGEGDGDEMCWLTSEEIRSWNKLENLDSKLFTAVSQAHLCGRVFLDF